MVKAGDVLFSYDISDDLDQAISQVEQGRFDLNYNHVALMVSETLVIEATPELGVKLIDLESFKEKHPNLVVAGFNKALNIDYHHLLNKPYNDLYIKSDPGYYCSELVIDLLQPHLENRIQLQPLSFKDENHDIAPFWIEYYASYNMEVPVNELGSNPQFLSKLAIYDYFYIYESLQLTRIHFEEIDSTNLYLKKAYHELNSGVVVSASHQNQGRGRFERTWLDQKQNVLMSYLNKSIKQVDPRFSIVVGLILCELFNELGYEVMLKWPNDLILANKKLGGILIETSFSSEIDALIIGIGINSSQTTFDKEIATKAISLQSYRLSNPAIKKMSEDQLIKLIQIRLTKSLTTPFNQELFEKYNYLKGQNINYHGQDYIYDHLSDDGSLVIKNQTSIINIKHQEITLENIYKEEKK